MGQFKQLRQLCCTARRSNSNYVSTPIFYVNSKPHLGHMYSMILADVSSRYSELIEPERQSGWMTGVDEHGLKIMKASQSLNMSPMQLCDSVSHKFRELSQSVGACSGKTSFIRTSEVKHCEAVKSFWKVLRDKGFIYKANHTGWYSLDDETFFTNSAVEDKLVDDGIWKKVSKETGNVVEWSDEMTYHFKLSKMKESLLSFYHENPNFIIPCEYNDLIVYEIQNSMKDLSISRPRNRLPWGIPVPDDDSQTVYVWLDALVNYLTQSGYKNTSQTDRWPIDMHIIGKDIIRFHAIYWPAFLMAAELPIPNNLLVHSHWTVNKLKMSKSKGNGVDPFEILSTFGIDTIRYYLIYNGRYLRDTDFNADNIFSTYDTMLKNRLGNLVHRILTLQMKTKSFAVKIIQNATSVKDDEKSAKFKTCLLSIEEKVAQYINQREYFKIVALLDDVAIIANQYIFEKAPWNFTAKMMDNPSEDIKMQYAYPLYLCMEAIRIIAIGIKPVCPEKCNKILDLLNVRLESRCVSNLKFNSDMNYGILTNKPSIIFPNLQDYV